VTIIAILAAILLPVLEKAGRLVRTAECLNNMKELQTCYRMYVEDNNGWLPGNGVAGGESWITNNNAQTTVLIAGIKNGVLYPYDRDVKIYQCPSNTRTIPAANGTEVLQARQEYGNAGITFGTLLPQTRTCSINYPLGGITQIGTVLATGIHPINKYSQMIAPNPTPARMYVFVDENEYSVDDGDFAMYPAGSGVNEWWNMPGSRHGRGSTWSYADGHCEYWKWHGSVVPSAELHYNGAYTPADNSDDLARVQAGTSPLGN
jgi:prepilin-type processing-associated H-X9-DG protein